MRIARIDIHQPGASLPFERGIELPRHELDIEHEIAYFRDFEGATTAQHLPARFPVLARVKLTIPNQPPVTLVLRDCGAY